MAKKRTILDLQKMKETGEQAVWMVIYDSCLAACAEEAGMDMILVGDSMGMIIYGWEGTVPVTMDSARDDGHVHRPLPGRPPRRAEHLSHRRHALRRVPREL